MKYSMLLNVCEGKINKGSSLREEGLSTGWIVNGTEKSKSIYQNDKKGCSLERVPL